MAFTSLLVCLLVAVLAVFGCQPPDCDHPDHGTCVQACCKIAWNVTGTDAKSFATTMADTLKNGGPDGRYELWGTVPNQVYPSLLFFFYSYFFFLSLLVFMQKGAINIRGTRVTLHTRHALQ